MVPNGKWFPVVPGTDLGTAYPQGRPVDLLDLLGLLGLLGS